MFALELESGNEQFQPTNQEIWQPETIGTGNFVFTLADIIAVQKINGFDVQLDAFGSKENSLILADKNITQEASLG